MNNDDLERDLRSQRGPREAGYTPVRVPMRPEESQVASRRPSRLPRAAMLIGAGLAGALAIAIAAGVFSGSRPEVGATNSTLPSAEATPMAEASTPVARNCLPADVAFSAEPWGGAAGSRGTIVTIRLADGRSACTLPGRSATENPPSLVAFIQDANGLILLSSGPELVRGPGDRSLPLEPGATHTLSVVWSNWCGDPPARPVTLLFRALNWTAPVPVAIPAGGADPVPPCLGDDPSQLSLTDLQPQS